MSTSMSFGQDNIDTRMQGNHNAVTVESIENIRWVFRGEFMDLFSGADTPLDKNFEFNKPNLDPTKIIGSHAVPHGQEWFSLEFFSGNRCKLTWKGTVAHYVIGTTTSSYTMIGKWEIKRDKLLIYYEYPLPVVTLGGHNTVDKTYNPSKYTHASSMKYRLDDGNLILTPVEVKSIE